MCFFQLSKQVFTFLESKDFSFCSLELATYLHPLESTINMVIVHIKVVTLERISIHSSVNRVQVEIPLRVLFVYKTDHHFVRSDMDSFKDDVITILKHFDSRHIQAIVITGHGHCPVEQKCEWCFAPRQVSILSHVYIAPYPVFRVLGDAPM